MQIKLKYTQIIFQIATILTLFIILPFLVERNWVMWSREPILYFVAAILIIPISIIGNSVIYHIGRYQYVLAMIMIFLLYRNLPIYINNFANALPPDFDLAPLVPIAERKAVSKLFMPFMLVAIIVLAQSTIRLFNERKQIRQEKLEAELAMLKSQINPHFFFNSLNSIYHLTLTNDERAPQAVIRLSDMMRYVLTDARAERVSVNQEIEYINQYIELQRSRIPKFTKIDYRVSLDDNDVKIAPLLLISFIENAFKYGISSNFESIIQVHISLQNSSLNLFVKNEIHNNLQNTYGTASGIINVKKRLEGIYPKNYSLEINQAENQYIVSLCINLNNDKLNA